ncbi:ISAzo13-like element transposase-related protein, partial [Streptomyces olivoreticuli]
PRPIPPACSQDWPRTCRSGARTQKIFSSLLALETGLQVTVCHFPPGTSKWNRIEHRLFSHITMNWRGRPLTSHEIIVQSIAATTTRTGLKVHAELDTATYATGIRIGNEQMDTLPLVRHDWHGDWNYTLLPESARPALGPRPDPTPARPGHAWLFHPAITGIPADEWEDLIPRLAILRHAQREAALHDRRGGSRQTAPGTGRKAVLTLADRALAAVLHRRFSIPERTIATLFGVSQQSINKTIRQTDQLLTLAGYAPESTTRIRTLTEFLAFATAEGITTPAEIKPAC